MNPPIYTVTLYYLVYSARHGVEDQMFRTRWLAEQHVLKLRELRAYQSPESTPHVAEYMFDTRRFLDGTA